MLQPELLLPFSLSEKLVGIMSLGPKQSDESFHDDSVIRLETGGPVLGLLPNVQYEQETLTLDPPTSWWR